MARRRDKGEEREIARARVATLVRLADEALLAGRRDRADRYAALAWKVKTAYQVRQSGLEPRICRACKAFLRPGMTSRVRLRAGVRTTTCLACGAIRRRVLGAPPSGAA